MSVRKKRWQQRDWEAYAGVVAAIAALVLHLLHIAEAEVMVAVALVLLALLLIRDLHRESREEEQTEMAQEMRSTLARLSESTALPEATLVGPRRLREQSMLFAREAQGEMVWFNVCLSMFRPQSLFDALLRPALENPLVTSVSFILDPGETSRWESEVLPKARECSGFEKLRDPSWVSIKHEAISFVLADFERDGHTEAQLSFWGEPFMANTAGRDVPRFLFRVHAHSELIPRLVEIERSYRLGNSAG